MHPQLAGELDEGPVPGIVGQLASGGAADDEEFGIGHVSQGP